jgi:hypothetical protein
LYKRGGGVGKAAASGEADAATGMAIDPAGQFELE